MKSGTTPAAISKKLETPKARCTAFLSGKIKRLFYEDIQRTGSKETEHVNMILAKYYDNRF